MEMEFERVVDSLQKRYATIFPDGTHGFAVRLPGGKSALVGRGDPAATLVCNDAQAVSALASLDVARVGEAYLAGSLDVMGDLSRLLALRKIFRDRHPLLYLMRFVKPAILGQVRADRAAIAHHYDEDAEFYRLWLDSKHRCYSQAVFAHDDEALEDAVTRKLDFALESIGAKPGDRVLDIGGGWGAFTEYAGRKGIRVTSLTISAASRDFVQGLIDEHDLPCEVRMEHLYEHSPDRPYDAIVNLGVTEHLPDYAATLQRYLELLKPGGKVYLDASAGRKKYDLTSFFERHIYRGNGALLCLHEYVTALASTPFELEVVINDRHNYGLTARHWALNLDRHRDEIERRWGRYQFRRFQIYLWGCVDGFSRDTLQAYRWVLRKPG